MKRILILLTLAITTCSSCKKWQHKYPEDTERTKLTPTERIINKWWVLDAVTLNGINYMDSVTNKIGKMRVYLTDDKADINNLKGILENDAEFAKSIIWTFFNNENQIAIYRTNGSIPFFLPVVFFIDPNFPSFYDQPYDVLKLSTSELKISIRTKSNDTVIINKFIIE